MEFEGTLFSEDPTWKLEHSPIYRLNAMQRNCWWVDRKWYPEVSTSRYLSLFLVCDKIRWHMLQCVAMRCNDSRRQQRCKTASVMLFPVSWSACRAFYGCFTRSEEHHEVGRSAIPPELRERVRRWHQRMVDTETGTCMHMRRILLNPGDFRFLSRQ